MARRHRNNLGTGIQWGYGPGNDPHWRQNSKTGGWFYVEDLSWNGNPPAKSPVARKSQVAKPIDVNCQYKTSGNKCSLWNSGFYGKQCSSYRCKYHLPQKQCVDTLINCQKCTQHMPQCNETGEYDKKYPNKALYCCYFDSRPEIKNVSGSESAIPTVFILPEKTRTCIVDGKPLSSRGIFLKRKRGVKRGEFNLLYCSTCGRTFLPRGMVIPPDRYIVHLETVSSGVLEKSQPTRQKKQAIPGIGKPSTPVLPKVVNSISISKLRVGCKVNHKVYGEGTIRKIDIAKKSIIVMFSTGEKKFVFPDSFYKGFLTL